MQPTVTGETSEELATIFNLNPCSIAIERVLSELRALQGEDRSSRCGESAAQQIAKFLHECKGLDPGKIGEWLSLDDGLSAASLEALLFKYRFTGLTLHEALQLFLSNIRLPARLCSAETILLAFSRHYHRSDASLSVDTVAALCLSAHLLSMNLHSSMGSLGFEHESKEECISRVRFVQHCQQVGLEGDDHDGIGDFAGRIYDAIELRAIHSDGRPCMGDDTRTRSMSSVPTQHQGWLHFQEICRHGQGRHTGADEDGEAALQVAWRRRYVLLNDLGVFIFRVPPLLAVDCELMCSLPLQDIVISEPPSAPSGDDQHAPGACTMAGGKTGAAHGTVQSHTGFQLRGCLVECISGDEESTSYLPFLSLLPESSRCAPSRARTPEASAAHSVLLLLRAESSARKQAWVEVCVRASMCVDVRWRRLGWWCRKTSSARVQGACVCV